MRAGDDRLIAPSALAHGWGARGFRLARTVEFRPSGSKRVELPSRPCRTRLAARVRVGKLLGARARRGALAASRPGAALPAMSVIFAAGRLDALRRPAHYRHCAGAAMRRPTCGSNRHQGRRAPCSCAPASEAGEIEVTDLGVGMRLEGYGLLRSIALLDDWRFELGFDSGRTFRFTGDETLRQA